MPSIENTNRIAAKNSLGKGEVDSSILSGSTRKPRLFGTFCDASVAVSAVDAGTEHESRKSYCGKSVDSVRQAFARFRIGGEWKAKADSDHQRARCRMSRPAPGTQRPSGVARSSVMVADGNCHHPAVVRNARRDDVATPPSTGDRLGEWMMAVLPKSRIIKVQFEVALPISASRDEIEEWITFECGRCGAMSCANHLSEYAPEAISAPILTDTGQHLHSEATPKGNGSYSIKRWRDVKPSWNKTAIETVIQKERGDG